MEEAEKQFSKEDMKALLDNGEPYISKEDYERLMAQGKREDMDRLFEYALIKFKESGKKEGLIKVKEEYAQVFLSSDEEFKKKDKQDFFKDKKLIFHIKNLLSEDHLGDDNAKMTGQLIAISGLLKNPKLRMSAGITGNSSTGKNNLIETNIKHLPDNSYIYVSSATQSTLEEDIQDKRIVAFKEINFKREDGENKHLLGVWKQLVEGGTRSLKKDVRTGYKTSRFEEGEQKTTLYPTTETDRDPEAETRAIFIGISTDYERIKKVNENTCDNFADVTKLIKNSNNQNSWLKNGLTKFFNKEEQPEILIPYAKFLKEKIDGKDIFDHNNPRSQRDIKRLLALTCTMTYLYQEQRKFIEHDGHKILISEPEDFILTLKIAGEFFNQTYSGLDGRLNSVLNIIKTQPGEWVARDLIQNKLDVSRNTIKGYCQTLSDIGLIEGTNGKSLNEFMGGNTYDGNKIYYKRCNKGIKKPLLRCDINRLKEFLEEKSGKMIDSFNLDGSASVNEEKEGVKGIKKEGVNLDKNTINAVSSNKIDTFSLTPLNERNPLEEEETGIDVLRENSALRYNTLTSVNDLYLPNGQTISFESGTKVELDPEIAKILLQDKLIEAAQCNF